MDVTYQSCTAPCCGCWKAYWPQLLVLWGRCGVPANTFKGEGIVGSYKAKEDWYCGNGVWGTCVVPKWDAAQAQLTECTSGPDQSKLKEPFGLYRNRRSEAESCACLAQAYRALDSILRECQVPSWLWFKGYSQRRFTDNHCGSLDSGEAAFNLNAAEGHETAFQWKWGLSVWGLSVKDQKPVRVKVGMQASLCRILSTMQQWCRQP